MHLTSEGNFEDYPVMNFLFLRFSGQQENTLVPLNFWWTVKHYLRQTLHPLQDSQEVTTPLLLVVSTHLCFYFKRWDSFSCISLNKVVVLWFKKTGLFSHTGAFLYPFLRKTMSQTSSDEDNEIFFTVKVKTSDRSSQLRVRDANFLILNGVYRLFFMSTYN